MHRRKFIGTLAGGAAAAAVSTRVQGADKIPCIGIMSGTRVSELVGAFIKGLEELGYAEGKNIKIERRQAEAGPQMFELFPAMVADLVRLEVSVIVAGSGTIALIAQRVTTTVPIVVQAIHDGVGIGAFKSLARPGGNMTGTESMAPELDAKRVEMAKQVLPHMSRLTVLYDSTFAGTKIHLEMVPAAAKKFDIAVRFEDVQSVSDFDRAFAAILSDRPDAVYVIPAPLIFNFRKPIRDFAVEHKIPMFHEFKIFVEEGGLISYGPDILEIWRRGASYVDKILKGQKPGDLPVEQPTKFDLAINLKTAKALGIAIPNSLIASANLVIE
jgi:putative ABC transport system substrate-binding protein